MQMCSEQAETLLDYLDRRLSTLATHYEENGYSEDRADNALDELTGIRDGVRGSALSPVDAALFLGVLDDLEQPDIVEALEAIVYG